ncbi:hypothetical protein NF675_03430 [Pseudomonas siliginis]|uniref:hypothetical protein n=1 Tax=Pseudomonas siliginis TaxID=2842346 RepID=UPI002092FA97|nr:hypothetical protein [Pseudomonas siliginis]UST75155.1 hypothetical protein NF675_03430 [Pseudomonas siliginis]
MKLKELAGKSKGCLKGKGWIVALVIGLGVVGVASWKFFRLYNKYLPYISDNPDAWGSFGSLLSAFITLAGFVITIATLLFLNSQNQSQKSFIDWQKKTQGFDWYIKHRQLHMERLRELQVAFGDQIRFRNPEKLYEGIFQDNYLMMAGFAKAPQRSEHAGKLLDHIAGKLDRLDENTQKAVWNRGEVRSFASDLIDVTYDLQIEWIGEDSDGDLKWNGRNTGINIYSIEEATARVHAVFDSLSYFAGLPEYKGFRRSPMSYLKDALIEYFIHHRSGGLLQVIKTSPYLPLLEDLLPIVKDLRDDAKQLLMPRTYNAIVAALRSRNDVRKLGDGAATGNIYDIGYVEAAVASDRSDIDEENRESLANCVEALETIQVVLAYNNAPGF